MPTLLTCLQFFFFFFEKLTCLKLNHGKELASNLVSSIMWPMQGKWGSATSQCRNDQQRVTLEFNLVNAEILGKLDCSTCSQSFNRMGEGNFLTHSNDDIAFSRWPDFFNIRKLHISIARTKTYDLTKSQI